MIGSLEKTAIETALRKKQARVSCVKPLFFTLGVYLGAVQAHATEFAHLRCADITRDLFKAVYVVGWLHIGARDAPGKIMISNAVEAGLRLTKACDGNPNLSVHLAAAYAFRELENEDLELLRGGPAHD